MKRMPSSKKTMATQESHRSGLKTRFVDNFFAGAELNGNESSLFVINRNLISTKVILAPLRMNLCQLDKANFRWVSHILLSLTSDLADNRLQARCAFYS